MTLTLFARPHHGHGGSRPTQSVEERADGAVITLRRFPTRRRRGGRRGVVVGSGQWLWGGQGEGIQRGNCTTHSTTASHIVAVAAATTSCRT